MGASMFARGPRRVGPLSPSLVRRRCSGDAQRGNSAAVGRRAGAESQWSLVGIEVLLVLPLACVRACCYLCVCVRVAVWRLLRLALPALPLSVRAAGASMTTDSPAAGLRDKNRRHSKREPGEKRGGDEVSRNDPRNERVEQQ